MRKVVFKRSALLDAPFDEGEVSFFDGFGGKEVAHGGVSGGVARDEDESASAGINAMESAGHEGSIAEGYAFRVPGGDTVHERMGLGARKWMDALARGLIKREEVGIGIDFIDADGGVREDMEVVGFREGADLDARARGKTRTLEGTAGIKEYIARCNRLADKRTG